MYGEELANGLIEFYHTLIDKGISEEDAWNLIMENFNKLVDGITRNKNN